MANIIAICMGLWIVINLCIYPQAFRFAIIELISNSIFLTDQLYTFGAWLLVVVISLILLPAVPYFISHYVRLPHIAFISGHEGNNSINYIISSNNPVNSGNTPGNNEMQAADISGIIGGSTGMMMVADGTILFVNKDFCRLTGYNPAEIIGKDFVDLILPHDIVKYVQLSRTQGNNIPLIQGIGIRTANSKNIEIYIAGNRNSQIDPNEICIFYLRETEKSKPVDYSSVVWFMDTLDKTNANIWIWDSEGLIYINPTCKQLLPVSLNRLIKNPLLMLKSLPFGDRKTIKASLVNYFSTFSFDEDVRIINGNGDIRWFRVHLSPERGSDGSVLRHIGIAYEITAQQHELESMKQAREYAEVANANKTAFLANMSHEIRSPLNGILGFSELLVDPDLPIHEREKYISIIQNNGTALLSILTDIIDISKLETGKLKIIEKEFRPADLMRELQMQFTNDPLVTRKGLVMKWMIGDDIAGIKLISDPYRLRQILVNLISNALKFTNQGKIEVVSENWDDKTVFWIKDSGVGIPAESTPYIFDRYRQVTRPDWPNMNGFGLGLAICKALVELLGGNIWVESLVGRGSIFYFTIPYTTPKLNEMNNMTTVDAAFPYNWKGRTILIAEDIDFSFLYIEAVLRRTGARVLWAQNGREAIEIVKVNPGIDIALMDIHMPIMNGYDATREIIKIRPDLPIIAQTAFVLPDDVKACYAAGCSGYLAKPIRREQLLNTLSDYFEKIDQRNMEHEGNQPVYRSKIS